jgi:hypothetical protein
MSSILSSLRTLHVRLSGKPASSDTSVLPTIHLSRLLTPLQVVVIHSGAKNVDNTASAPRIEASPRLGPLQTV